MRLSLSIPAAAARPFDVAGFGLNSVDLLAVVAEFPASNSKQRLQRVTRLPGGQIATAMATCARLGWRASYVGSFGSDDLGALSRASLIDAGVDVSASRTVAGATNQFAIILVDAQSGARTVLWDRHPDLAWSPGDVPRLAVTAGRMLLVEFKSLGARKETFALESTLSGLTYLRLLRGMRSVGGFGFTSIISGCQIPPSPSLASASA